MARSNRPTLPPLHSLGLPRGDIPSPRVHESHDLNTPHRPPEQPHVPLRQPYSQQRQQPLIAPAVNPTPPATHPRPHTNAPASAPAPASTPTPFPTRDTRLLPTSYENAEVVILIPPANVPSRPAFFFGPELERLRRGEYQLAVGTRVLPYRVVRGPPPPTEPSHTEA